MTKTDRSARILFTIVGYRDPFSKSGQDRQAPGPVLSLLSEMDHFTGIVLVHTGDKTENACTLKQIIQERHGIETVTSELKISDPTDYEDILQGLRRVFRETAREVSDGHYYVSMSSGTPQMHASWLLLTASGEIPARLLQVREERYQKPDQLLVREIDPRVRVFPRVLPSTTPVIAQGPDQARILKLKQEIGIVGDHPALMDTLTQAARVAGHDASVMILGENGTGKDLLARYVHKMSPRAKGPLISVNCASIPENMAESQLFGHRKGAFTGAERDHAGYFMQAHGGTLFLDEAGELPPYIQAKLLRAIQQKEFYRIGDTAPSKVDFRLISATNRDMARGIDTGEVREDFYFRLNEFTLLLPPLRERKTDIPSICASFLPKFNKINQNLFISPDAYETMYGYHWPGNIRELYNRMQKASIMSVDGVITARDIFLDEPLKARSGIPEPFEGFSMESHTKNIRAKLIDRAMEKADGNMSLAARLLGMSAQAMYKEMKKRQSS
ncbi:sigma-54-dependent Fis family transcriptional regulator [Desulfonatronovibrio hydrogenovorans]|uniref:sigma-54-dependent Fis family transcriptional regulator n=1 Tax=Desulfonatronovibrio hydrogenovorans TaxID=53245 RepID=UPI00069086A9|nr:sigma-54-dependent Fis family transcriptional regulator [Desulfonatronovibrio hydrogenovorans]